MKKIKAIVVGLGNIGRAACDAIALTGDIELAGIVRRKCGKGETHNGIPVTDNAETLGKVDVAILASPSRNVADEAEKYLKMGINTVDSFDIHGDIWGNKQRLDGIAKKHGAVAIISTGFDPGIDSVVRALMLAAVPKGITTTNFGPGMSLGHTVAVKKIQGVRDALSLTIPAGMGIHNRMVYIEIENGADFNAVASNIKSDPYFVNDDTKVIQTPCVRDLIDHGHGVNLIRRGISGTAHNQHLEYNMRINNPALTAQMMAASARASKKQAAGCYTIIEIPPIDLLPGTAEEQIRALV